MASGLSVQNEYSKNIILLDWLTFSVKSMSLEDVKALLGLWDMVEWQELKGFYGYENRLYYCGMSINYGGNNDTICCELSGQGCRAFETYSFYKNFGQLLNFIYLHSDIFNLTRLDVAYDDFDGFLNLKTIDKALADNLYTSKFSNIRSEVPRRGDVGFTIYFGSMKSNTMFRIYDKRAERSRSDLDHWIRFELQLRDESAKNFLNALEIHNYNVGFCFYGVVNNYIRFVVNNDDTHLYRRPSARWWRKFIEHTQKISVFTAKDVNYNLSGVKNYVCNQAGNAIQCLINVYGLDEVGKLIKNRDILYSKKYMVIEKQSKAFRVKNPDYPFQPFSDTREGDVMEVIDVE